LGKEPQATFSTCYAAPFLALSPRVYADLLGEKLNKYNTRVWLVNTGWAGGAFGKGKRMSLPYTRAMIRAAMKGQLDPMSFVKDEVFGLSIPRECLDIPSQLLNPALAWQNHADYLQQATQLLKLFDDNALKYQAAGK